MTTYPPTVVSRSPDRHSPGGRPRRVGAPLGGPLSSLRALVVLSGVVRAGGWVSDIGRSVLDLPIGPRRTLLVQWLEQAVDLASVPGVERLSVEVLVDRVSPLPRPDGFTGALPGSAVDELRVERDSADYRGTGGVLRDLSLRYQDDDYLLVASGAQVLTGSLQEQAAVLASRAADVALVAYDDGTPAGTFWVRCGCLKMISDVGFVDLKEQALSQIARLHRVEVVKLPPVGMPLRTPTEYLRALRQSHVRNQFDDGVGTPFAEDWRPVFSLIEDGADVHASAQVHDSVVLKGGRVGPNAVVVRSLVGPGGLVPRNGRVIGQFVNGARRSRDQS